MRMCDRERGEEIERACVCVCGPWTRCVSCAMLHTNVRIQVFSSDPYDAILAWMQGLLALYVNVTNIRYIPVLYYIIIISMNIEQFSTIMVAFPFENLVMPCASSLVWLATKLAHANLPLSFVDTKHHRSSAASTWAWATPFFCMSDAWPACSMVPHMHTIIAATDNIPWRCLHHTLMWSSLLWPSSSPPHTEAIVWCLFSKFHCRFDYDAANVKGIVLPQEGEDDIDPR